MDDKENGSRYLPKASGLNNQQDNSFSLHPKVFNFNSMYPRADNPYPGDEEEDLEDEESGDEDVETNGAVKMIGEDTYDEEEEDEDFDGDDDEEEEEEEGDDNCDDSKRYNGKAEDIGTGRPQKKRKLRTLISNYEFAPRIPNPTPFVQKAISSHPSAGGQNSVGDWTERETFALLDAWGDLFLRLGRKSLRSEEWQEVAEKVSQETNIDRTDVQCRNRLDTLKKKYKKEKTRLISVGSKGGSKWVFYRKMDMLLLSSTTPQQQTGLSCGIDSGEFVFMNPNVYLNRANGLDEMRDSPENSPSLRDEEGDDLDGLPPKGKRNRGKRVEGSSSFQLLADSIHKFSEIYEKIESNKGKQMVELENMRMDLHRQLETQRRQILERAQAEIARIRQANDYGNDLSAENLSG